MFTIIYWVVFHGDGRWWRRVLMDWSMRCRRSLLHWWKSMSLRVVRRLRRVVVLIGTSLLFSTALVLQPPLIVYTTLILHASLIFSTASFRRAATENITRGCGWSSMVHVIHACSVLLRCWLFDGWLIFPFPHSLWASRSWPFMVSLYSSGFSSSQSSSRGRSSSLNPSRI